MSDTKNDMQATEDAEFEVEVEVEDSETIQTPKKGNGIAWLALLVSGLALVAVGYVQFENWRTNDNSSEVDYVAKIEDLDRFGRDYVDYMRQTGRFLPRIRRRST